MRKLKLRLAMVGVVCGLSFVYCSNRVFAMENEQKDVVSSSFQSQFLI